MLGSFSYGFLPILLFDQSTPRKVFHVPGVRSWVVSLAIAGSPDLRKFAFSAVVCYTQALWSSVERRPLGAPKLHLTTFFRASRPGKKVVRLVFVVRNGQFCSEVVLGGRNGHFRMVFQRFCSLQSRSGAGFATSSTTDCVTWLL